MTNSQKSTDKIYELWVHQLIEAEKTLPQYTRTAEIWAEKVIKEGGEVYAAGDMPFWRECVHRAGGIGFIRKLTPDVVLDSHDVVLVGFEYANDSGRKEIIEPIIKSGATVLLFAEVGADKTFENIIKPSNQLILIPCEKGLDGLVSTDSDKFVTLTGMTHILHMWITSAEFVGACTRMNRMPNMYVSITHPRGWSINGGYFASRFYQDKAITPVEKEVLGRQYLDKMKLITKQIGEEGSREKIHQAATRVVSAMKENHSIHETLAGHWALYQNLNQYTPTFMNSHNRLGKDDVRISLDYNYYSKEEIERYLSNGTKVIYLSTSDRDNDKFKGIALSSNGQKLAGWDEIPKREDLVAIDGHFAQYDATLTLPDYPYPFCPSSWISHGLVHWILISEILDIQSGK